MHRFFAERDNITETDIVIVGEDVRHIKNVLRLELGEKIEVSDKEGTDYICEISDVSKESVECNVIESFKSKGEAPIEIVLFQGLPKSTKMELIIQKATELGVREIVPLVTERCIVKINDRKKEDKKIERWSKIAEEAAKQSKRGFVPAISPIMSFKEAIAHLADEEMVVVPYENEDNLGLKSVLKDSSAMKVNIVIGPEGGFEQSEIEALKDIDSHIVTLGPRILRTETAGFTASIIVQYELGDLGSK